MTDGCRVWVTNFLPPDTNNASYHECQHCLKALEWLLTWGQTQVSGVLDKFMKQTGHFPSAVFAISPFQLQWEKVRRFMWLRGKQHHRKYLPSKHIWGKGKNMGCQYSRNSTTYNWNGLPMAHRLGTEQVKQTIARWRWWHYSEKAGSFEKFVVN